MSPATLERVLLRKSAWDGAAEEQGEGGAHEEARRDFKFVGSCKGQGSALHSQKSVP